MSTFVTLNSNDDKCLATDFQPGGVSNTDPFSANRLIGYDDGRTRAGQLSLDGGMTADGFPHWEMLIVTEGNLTFGFDATTVNIAVGGCVIINRGSRFELSTNGPAKCVFLSVTDDSSENPEPATLVFLDKDADLFAAPSFDSEVLITAAPTCRNHRMHVRDDIAVRAGVWDATPFERKLLVQQEHELMHITRGSMTFSDSEGREQTYSAGETFLVPKGVNGRSTCREHVAKIYAVVS